MLVSLFMLSLNSISTRFKRTERAPMFMRFLGYVSMLWLVELNAGLFLRHVSPDSDTEGQLTAVGLFDMYATRKGRASLGQSVLVFGTAALSLKILWSQTSLFWWTMKSYYATAWNHVREDVRIATSHPLLQATGSKLKQTSAPLLAAGAKAGGRCAQLRCSLGRLQSVLKRWGAGARRFVLGVPPVMDGQMEDRLPNETRAEERQRCARNYVRKMLRGRGWVREQLFREQENINAYRYTGWLRERLFGVERRVRMHLRARPRSGARLR